MGSIAGVISLSIILAVAGFAYVYYTGSLDHNPERARGEEFGPTTDQQGCLDESLRRVRAYPDSTFFERRERSHIPSFTSGCFSTCKPSRDFCVGVPRINELMDGIQYIERHCNGPGLDNGACSNVFRRVIKECKTYKQTVVSYPDN